MLLGCGDHHPSEFKPFRTEGACAQDDTCSDCTPEGLAIFLLVVEEGVFLGANGWSAAFERPLGQPNGPARNITASDGRVVGLSRSFASGTSVHYNLSCVNSPPRLQGYNCSRIDWAA